MSPYLRPLALLATLGTCLPLPLKSLPSLQTPYRIPSLPALQAQLSQWPLPRNLLSPRLLMEASRPSPVLKPALFTALHR